MGITKWVAAVGGVLMLAVILACGGGPATTTSRDHVNATPSFTSPDVRETPGPEAVGGDEVSTEPIDVMLLVETEIQPNRRVIVRGKTNLPPGTSLGASIEDTVIGEIRGQTSTEVTSDQSYLFEPLGPTTGLKDGVYVASVTMPVSHVQVEQIQKIIGKKGEMLRGSLVNDSGVLGASVHASTEFRVGGADAQVVQTERLTSEIAAYRRVVHQIEDLHVRLQATYSKRLLDDEANLDSLRQWGTFARKFRSDSDAIRDRIGQFDSLLGRMHLASAHGAVDSMFHDAAFRKPDEYAMSEERYQEGLTEVKAFLAERQTQVSDAAKPEATLDDSTLREWTDNTGKFRITAEFAGYGGGKVTLRKADESKVKVPIERLSDEDLEFLRAIWKARGEQPGF